VSELVLVLSVGCVEAVLAGGLRVHVLVVQVVEVVGLLLRVMRVVRVMVAVAVHRHAATLRPTAKDCQLAHNISSPKSRRMILTAF
jgi:hypothetical protein